MKTALATALLQICLAQDDLYAFDKSAELTQKFHMFEPFVFGQGCEGWSKKSED